MNWYKKAQVAMANRPDLSVVTPSQWKAMNDRMVGLGYDFRGAEDTKQIFERLNKSPGGLQEDHSKVFESVVNSKEYATKYSPQKTRGTFQRAINYFGLTSNPREAGYVLPNGAMLDLSGRRDGGPGDTRALDHREVNTIIPMPEFISMGAIRHFPELPGVDIRRKPTPQQLSFIYKDVENSPRGYTLEIKDYQKGRLYQQYDPGVMASKVIGDMRRFYGDL